jgi:hypothetical protein
MPKEPREEWLIAEGVDGTREYVVHTYAPAFIAQIFDSDEAPVLGEIEYAMTTGQMLSRFYWYDEPVTGDREFMALCEATEEAVVEYDRILETDQV